MTTVNFSVKGADTAPVVGALIDITLTQAGVDAIGESVILPTSVQGKTDVNGNYSVDLAPVSTAPYIAVVLDNNGRRKGVYDFYVPDSELPVDVDDLVLFPKPSGVTYDAAAIAAIANNRVLAQQAADSILNHTTPRYKVKDLVFLDEGGTQTARLTAEENNGFLQVVEPVGQILVPVETTTNFAIGSAFLFVNSTPSKAAIDIDFIVEDPAVTLDALSVNVLKLQNVSDIIVLVKTAANTWKILNLSSGGGSYDSSILALSQTITSIQDDISTLQGWRLAFDTQLNNQSTSISNHTLAISQINSAIAGLNSALAVINLTIDERISAAIPTLGDIQAYVDAAEGFKDLAEAGAVTSQAAVVASGINAANSAINEGNSLTYRNEAEAFKDTAEQAAIDALAVVTNFIDIQPGDAGKTVIVNATEDGLIAQQIQINPWLIATAIYEPPEYNYKDPVTSDNGNNARSMHWSPDGLYMFVGSDKGFVHRHEAAVAFRVSTLSYSGNSIDLRPILGETNVKGEGLYIKSDGTRMFVADKDRAKVVQLDLVTPWDLTTAANLVDPGWPGGHQDRGVTFKPDGTRAYTCHENEHVHEYILTTPWDLSGGLTDLTTHSFDGDINNSDSQDIADIFIDDTGTTLLLLNRDNNGSIDQYNLSTPWDLTTSILITKFSIEEEINNSKGFHAAPDGTRVFLVDEGPETVVSYITHTISL